MSSIKAISGNPRKASRLTKIAWSPVAMPVSLERRFMAQPTSFSSGCRASIRTPFMQSFGLPQQRFGGGRLSPHAGRVFVRLGERRIDMDGAEDLVQAEAVLHGGDELHDQVAGVLPDEGGAEDAVLAWNGQHL